MSTEQNLTNDIKPINPNLDKLKQGFPHCFDKNGDFDFAKFKSELSASEINIAKEGYSLDWLGKSYARVLASDAATTLLQEDAVHNAKPENVNSQNLLIKGDNLEVLKHLSNAYYEKVKMIYIDPPYNTGSDGFVYNDDRKFTVKQLEDLAGVSTDDANRILEFTQSNSNSHSAWLTFMYPRLYIAKQLLKDDGVIFVSIDDNEVAQLRLLMDEVFGEENFIASFIWEKRTNRENRKVVSNKHDYIICFSKMQIEGVRPISQTPMTEKALSSYKNPDNDHRGLWKSDPATAQAGHGTKSQFYDLIAPNGKIHKLESGRCWLYTEDVMREAIKDNRIWFGKDGNGVPRVKTYLEAKERGLTPESILFAEEVGTTEIAKNKIKELFDGVAVFETPKSVELIKQIIQMSGKEGIILDFFGGSGTTAHSIMQLNAEDGGNRKYILVQLPERINAKKSKVAYDFVKDELGVTPPTVFEITKERIIRASKEIGDTSGFKIFETTPIWEDYDFKAEKLENAAKLFDEDKLTDEDVKALFTTWKTYDGITLTEEVQDIDLAGYKAYYTKQKLYLMHKGFTTDTLKALLEKIDADANFNPTAIIAFGYYFDSKALREIAENIKTYNNKKNIDIDFITRY